MIQLPYFGSFDGYGKTLVLFYRLLCILAVSSAKFNNNFKKKNIVDIGRMIIFPSSTETCPTETVSFWGKCLQNVSSAQA
jgi:hypothetical protein